MTRYKCLKCGSTLESPSSVAGQEDECPVCGQVCVVPTSTSRAPIIISVCAGGFLLLCVVVVALFWVSKDKTDGHSPSKAWDEKPSSVPPRSGPRVLKTNSNTRSADQPADLRCDRFDAAAVLEGDKLGVSLNTDLPDDTVLMVSVWRTYREKGKAERYTIDYFSEKSTVGKWRGKQVIDVNNEQAMRRFRAKREQLAKIDMAGQIESISDSIEIGLTVPVNQTNPAFGSMNKST